MLQPVSVLLVDDEETLTNLLRGELEQHKFTVDEALSGEAALKRLENKKYDVVLLDIRMPGMDGMEVLKTIKARQLASKVIMLTGVDELKIARDSLELGADDFLTKPYEIKTLITCINRVLKEK